MHETKPSHVSSHVLYEFLFNHFPSYRRAPGAFNVRRFAADLGRGRPTLYKVLNKGRLTPDLARRILELSGHLYPDDPNARITDVDLLPFILGD